MFMLCLTKLFSSRVGRQGRPAFGMWEERAVPLPILPAVFKKLVIWT